MSETDIKKECFLKVYDAVKDTIGEFYEGKPITLYELITIMTPVVTAVLRDHIDGDKDFTLEDKKKAYKEALERIQFMCQGMKEKGGKFD